MEAETVGLSGSDPYLIYSFLYHHVKIQKGKDKLEGLVEKVCRNIFNGMIELTMEGKTESFREPEIILDTGNLEKKEITFFYGFAGELDLTDEELFRELRENSQYGETVNDVLERTIPIKTRTMRISVGERVEV